MPHRTRTPADAGALPERTRTRSCRKAPGLAPPAVRTLALLLAAAVTIVAVPSSVDGQEPTSPKPCDRVEGLHRLDFWVGRWEVRVDGQTVDDNRIEKVLDGCAVTEHWSSARGGRGKSLFYYAPATDTWKQVWITSSATRPGGVKEKRLVADYAGPGVRFRGRIHLPDGTHYLDRTTLTPLEGGRVRQVIERSTDAGETWVTGFDAVYVPAAEAAEASRDFEP